MSGNKDHLISAESKVIDLELDHRKELTEDEKYLRKVKVTWVIAM